MNLREGVTFRLPIPIPPPTKDPSNISGACALTLNQTPTCCCLRADMSANHCHSQLINRQHVPSRLAYTRSHEILNRMSLSYTNIVLVPKHGSRPQA